MSFKLRVHRILRRIGWYVIPAARLPRGVDVFADLQRLRLLDEDAVILDIGANVGQFTEAALHALPRARVFAFEPVNSTYKSLSVRWKDDTRVECIRYAMSEKSGVAQMWLRENSVWNSLALFNNQETNSKEGYEEVPTETVDEFCRTRKLGEIGILKTDTEGFDLSVLRGAADVLKRTRAVLSEVTFLPGDKTHSQFSAVDELLRHTGFTFLAAYEFSGDEKIMHANALYVRFDSSVPPSESLRDV